MVNWSKIREDYPITKNVAYFLSAGMSPLSKLVYDSIMKEYASILEYGDIFWDQDREKVKGLCEDFAELLRTDTENLIFMQNSSTVMSMIALAFAQQMPRPFNIVSMQDEFPAASIAFEYQKISMRYVQPQAGRYSIQAILDLVDPQTLAVVTSYVQYATGFRQDLTRLGAELADRNILLIVNATQAVPYFPVDVKAMNISALSASLHKWGGAGHVGSLFFTSPAFRARFKAPLAGWLSVDPKEDFIHSGKNVPFELPRSACQYEIGTMNFQNLLALKTALHYFTRIGLENIRDRLFELTDHLIAGLKKIPVKIISPVESRAERSAIIVFSTASDNKKIVTALEEKGIYTSLRDGHIRISVNIFNDPKDIDRLLDELAGMLQAP